MARVFAPIRIAWGLFDYSVRALVAALARPFDVYHAHDLATLPVAWIAGRRQKARIVYDAHELFTEISRLGPTARGVFRWLEARLIHRVDRVITVNESIAAELARRYNVPSPAVVMNCPRASAVPPSRDTSGLRARVGLAPDIPIVLYQGMFIPHRGLENLVRACRRFTRAHVVFMGWGPLLTTLQDLARDEDVAERVHFIEGVPLCELLSFTAGADVGVIPYRNVGLNNYFSSPNKLFEYCAAGVPVAASRFPELAKFVDGLGIGRTFDPERPEEIADAVGALLDDPTALERARANVARVAPQFTWENESQKLIAVYASLGPVT